MKEKVDLRKIKTQKYILEATITLLKKKNFDQLTVADICREANISRSGFYLHYVDKFDMVNKCQIEYINQALKILSSKQKMNWNQKELLYNLLHLLETEGELMALLLSSHGSYEIQLQMKKTMKFYLANNMMDHIVNIDIKTSNERRYMSAFLANALLGVIQEWIDGGKKEPLDELLEILDKIMIYEIL